MNYGKKQIQELQDLMNNEQHEQWNNYVSKMNKKGLM